MCGGGGGGGSPSHQFFSAGYTESLCRITISIGSSTEVFINICVNQIICVGPI